MSTFTFSGHETFVCKQFWLKKGYDYVESNKKFRDNQAVVDLGVGKNMVSAINYWLKAFGILKNEELSEIAKFIFDDQEGTDLFLEDIGTIWLLHYLLIKTNHASIYHLFFNEFLREKPEFTKEQLHRWLMNKTEAKFSENTIKRDTDTLLKTYIKPKKSKSIEKDFMNIFVGLDLLSEQVEKYKVQVNEKNNLPALIFLYAILDNETLENTNSISLKDLRFSPNSVGLIFALQTASMKKSKNWKSFFLKKLFILKQQGIKCYNSRKNLINGKSYKITYRKTERFNLLSAILIKHIYFNLQITFYNLKSKDAHPHTLHQAILQTQTRHYPIRQSTTQTHLLIGCDR